MGGAAGLKRLFCMPGSMGDSGGWGKGAAGRA